MTRPLRTETRTFNPASHGISALTATSTDGASRSNIDHFKQFNDNYGHDAGDLALQNVAKTLLSAARPFDLFGRWGGEEFIGIIRNVDRDGLEIVGQRCLSLIEQTYVPLAQKLENVTISMGGTLARPAQTADVLLKRADSLMSRSKQQGRNRLTLA